MLSLKEAVGKRLMVNEHTNLQLDMNEGANLCRFNVEINYRFTASKRFIENTGSELTLVSAQSQSLFIKLSVLGE